MDGWMAGVPGSPSCRLIKTLTTLPAQSGPDQGARKEPGPKTQSKSLTSADK